MKSKKGKGKMEVVGDWYYYRKLGKIWWLASLAAMFFLGVSFNLTANINVWLRICCLFLVGLFSLACYYRSRAFHLLWRAQLNIYEMNKIDAHLIAFALLIGGYQDQYFLLSGICKLRREEAGAIMAELNSLSEREPRLSSVYDMARQMIWLCLDCEMN